MKFGPVDIEKSEGAILAHSASTPGGKIKKGRRLTAGDVEKLKQADIRQVIAATLEAGDIGEDEAAAFVAKAVVGGNCRIAEAFTGRANVYATADGVLKIDRDRLIALNRIDEGLTVATLAPYARVSAGQMIATIKVITFALERQVLDRAMAIVNGGRLVEVAAFEPHDIGLVLTDLPGSKASLLDKRVQAMKDRVEAMGSRLLGHDVVAHTRQAVRDATQRMLARGARAVLIFGASAIVDREDVIPGGVVDAGGEVIHLGMPVDPGNLLMLGRHGATPVIGVPSCASSPKTNGLDWVLERTLAGLDVTPDDITEMAAGGLLMEIATRPQPRAGGVGGSQSGRLAPHITAVVLASGRSTRMGPANKLLEDFEGKPLVCHVVEAARGSGARETIVVTGHDEERVRAALAGQAVTFVSNPDFANGLATSVAAGVRAVPPAADGAVVLLGDMPLVSSSIIDKLIAAFNPNDGRSVCVPFHNGKRGNPVIWPAELFPELARLSGDTGARHLISEHADIVAEVDIQSEAIFVDVDTPQALDALREGSDGQS